MKAIINLKIILLYIQYKCVRLFNKNSNYIILNDYLSKRNALLSFFKCYLQNKSLNSYITFCNDTNGIDLINMAFVWQKTKDGHNYWEGLHNDWRTKIETIN